MNQSGEKPLKPGGVGSKVVCGVETEAVDLDAAIICCVDFILPEAPQKEGCLAAGASWCQCPATNRLVTLRMSAPGVFPLAWLLVSVKQLV